MTQSITAFAAVAAALFSFVNIFVSNRLARSVEAQKWRRDVGLKAMTDFLETTLQLAKVNAEIETERSRPQVRAVSPYFESEELKDLLRRAGELDRKASHQLVEISLLARANCVKVGDKLLHNVRDWIDSDEYHKSRGDFVAACRAELGAGRRVELPRRFYYK